MPLATQHTGPAVVNKSDMALFKQTSQIQSAKILLLPSKCEIIFVTL